MSHPHREDRILVMPKQAVTMTALNFRLSTEMVARFQGLRGLQQTIRSWLLALPGRCTTLDKTVDWQMPTLMRQKRGTC
jgi:hypothetical protein